MDPNETYRLLKQAAQDGEWADALQFGAYLVAWLEKGGFWPDFTTYKMSTRKLLGLSYRAWDKMPEVWKADFRKLFSDLGKY